jgi:hypothetical protein
MPIQNNSLVIIFRKVVSFDPIISDQRWSMAENPKELVFDLRIKHLLQPRLQIALEVHRLM